MGCLSESREHCLVCIDDHQSSLVSAVGHQHTPAAQARSSRKPTRLKITTHVYHHHSLPARASPQCSFQDASAAMRGIGIVFSFNAHRWCVKFKLDTAALQVVRIGVAQLPAHEHHARHPFNRRHHHGECKTFCVCTNPRPFRSGSTLRLVRCSTCSRLWNGDTNAASNTWKVEDL